jgi:hypothetical protein
VNEAICVWLLKEWLARRALEPVTGQTPTLLPPFTKAGQGGFREVRLAIGHARAGCPVSAPNSTAVPPGVSGERRPAGDQWHRRAGQRSRSRAATGTSSRPRGAFRSRRPLAPSPRTAPGPRPFGATAARGTTAAASGAAEGVPPSPLELSFARAAHSLRARRPPGARTASAVRGNDAAAELAERNNGNGNCSAGCRTSVTSPNAIAHISVNARTAQLGAPEDSNADQNAKRTTNGGQRNQAIAYSHR